MYVCNHSNVHRIDRKSQKEFKNTCLNTPQKAEKKEARILNQFVCMHLEACVWVAVKLWHEGTFKMPFSIILCWKFTFFFRCNLYNSVDDFLRCHLIDVLLRLITCVSMYDGMCIVCTYICAYIFELCVATTFLNSQILLLFCN